MAQWFALRRQQTQPHVGAARRQGKRGRDDPVAAGDVGLLDAGTGDVERATLTGDSGLGRLVLRVKAAHTNLAAERGQQQPVAGGDAACVHRAGDDEPGSRQREGPVDRQAEAAAAAAIAGLGGGDGKDRAQLVDPVAAMRGDGQHVDAGEGRVTEERMDLRGDGGDALGRRPVGLGEHGDAARDAQQVEDGEMLARLRHDPVVGSDDEHDEIDAAGAGQHRAHQLLVAGHVDEAERVAVLVTLVGEAEVDRDAALLLLRQAIGVDAGERLDQRGLAVVDVPRGGDDHDRSLSLSSKGRPGCPGRPSQPVVLDDQALIFVSASSDMQVS